MRAPSWTEDAYRPDLHAQTRLVHELPLAVRWCAPTRSLRLPRRVYFCTLVAQAVPNARVPSRRSKLDRRIFTQGLQVDARRVADAKEAPTCLDRCGRDARRGRQCSSSGGAIHVRLGRQQRHCQLSAQRQHGYVMHAISTLINGDALGEKGAPRPKHDQLPPAQPYRQLTFGFELGIITVVDNMCAR